MCALKRYAQKLHVSSGWGYVRAERHLLSESRLPVAGPAAATKAREAYEIVKLGTDIAKLVTIEFMTDGPSEHSQGTCKGPDFLGVKILRFST